MPLKKRPIQKPKFFKHLVLDHQQTFWQIWKFEAEEHIDIVSEVHRVY